MLSQRRLTFSLVFAVIFLVFAVASLTNAQPLNERTTRYSFTVWNQCKHSFQPMFDPPLPGHGLTAWPVLKSGKHATRHFSSNTYRGAVYAPLKGSTQNGQINTTRAEFDVATGQYDISLANGYNVPVYVQLQGQQMQGECDAARCENARCADAYRKDSGLMRQARKGKDTTKPNHVCPPGFTNWVVYFC